MGKRKRRASAETSISTGVDQELLTDYFDVPELPDSASAPEIIEPRPSRPQSLFSLPNVPIDTMPPVSPPIEDVLISPSPSIDVTHLSRQMRA